eukprot:CAMPEP_0202690386 /NCGR_PEP_ID=MMETSP1385-20130828/5385_1 /ASSEMBLY_ACC=CAM_ASM_000861 /TAXON_ID=933848 /ORGANISM="Elphidium margaritaceum" /LENGTH=317 /DNA_ID=CAMNT_0049345647 /DNA_START=1 /DNA_END=954 /DNA_ORIENTATION=-
MADANLSTEDVQQSNTRTTEDENVKTVKKTEESVTVNVWHILKVFNKFKCSRIILSFLRVSHIISVSFLSKSFHRVVNRYYADCTDLDLSEFYGVLGSAEFDMKSFMNDFLPKFKSVSSLSLRYCSHLKVVHLDQIFRALTLESGQGSDDGNSANNNGGSNTANNNNNTSTNNGNEDENDESGTTDDCVKNEKIKKLSLYFCNKLNSRALWKISTRLVNLECLDLGRCYLNNINGLKLLGSLPLKELAISLDPCIQKTEAIDIYSLLIDEDLFRSLKKLDLSRGCDVLHEIEDLSDLEQQRKIEIIKPAIKIKHNKV